MSVNGSMARKLDRAFSMPYKVVGITVMEDTRFAQKPLDEITRLIADLMRSGMTAEQISSLMQEDDRKSIHLRHRRRRPHRVLPRRPRRE